MNFEIDGCNWHFQIGAQKSYTLNSFASLAMRSIIYVSQVHQFRQVSDEQMLVHKINKSVQRFSAIL